MKDIGEFSPIDKNDWRNWLELNHKKTEAIWLIFYKKKSPNHNLSWGESVNEALCFGWIDSTKKTIDSETYKQYFCKRKAKSNWSRVNKEKIETLTEQGLMKEEGYKSVEVAKGNGSWTILDKIEALVTPDDLKISFTNHKGSLEYFESLSSSAKKILLYWIDSAKKTETREKRVLEVAKNASQNLKPKQFR